MGDEFEEFKVKIPKEIVERVRKEVGKGGVESIIIEALRGWVMERDSKEIKKYNIEIWLENSLQHILDRFEREVLEKFKSELLEDIEERISLLEYNSAEELREAYPFSERKIVNGSIIEDIFPPEEPSYLDDGNEEDIGDISGYYEEYEDKAKPSESKKDYNIYDTEETQKVVTTNSNMGATQSRATQNKAVATQKEVAQNNMQSRDYEEGESLLYDEMVDPPFIKGVNPIKVTETRVRYSDGSIWDRVNKRWRKIGPMVDAIRKLEGMG